MATTRKTSSTSSKSKTTSVVEASAPVVTGPQLKKKELIEAVVTRSGIKKKDAKPVVEAVLDVLGDALADARELNLQPFGNLKVKRAKDMPNGKIMVAKVRQRKAVASEPVD